VSGAILSIECVWNFTQAMLSCLSCYLPAVGWSHARLFSPCTLLTKLLPSYLLLKEICFELLMGMFNFAHISIFFIASIFGYSQHGQHDLACWMPVVYCRKQLAKNTNTPFLNAHHFGYKASNNMSLTLLDSHHLFHIPARITCTLLQHKYTLKHKSTIMSNIKLTLNSGVEVCWGW
jgi:hypothetical protein